MRLTMYLYLYMLKWYCWRRELKFIWGSMNEDDSMIRLFVCDRYDNYRQYLLLLMSKKPAREPYQIYNRLRNLIRYKMILKRKPIEKHIVDFSCYKIVTYC